MCLLQLVAVFDVQRGRTDSPRETMSNGYSSAAPSPEPLHYYPHLQYQEPIRAEIEVNEASLKTSMSDLFLCISQLHLMRIHFKFNM